MSKWLAFFTTVFVCWMGTSFGDNMKQVVVFETTLGNVELTLKPDVAPNTCKNFVGLVNKGFYNGLIFHRVIKDFMCQGGCPQGNGMGSASIWDNKKFADEFNPNVKFSKKGILAMANSGPNTNGSQFFITTAPTTWLNNKHTIFGEVTAGQDVMDKMNNVKVGPMDKPLDPVKIVKAYVKE